MTFGLGSGLGLVLGIPNLQSNSASFPHPNLSHNPHSNPYTDCVCSKFNLAKCDMICVVRSAIKKHFKRAGTHWSKDQILETH